MKKSIAVSLLLFAFIVLQAGERGHHSVYNQRIPLTPAEIEVEKEKIEVEKERMKLVKYAMDRGYEYSYNKSTPKTEPRPRKAGVPRALMHPGNLLIVGTALSANHQFLKLALDTSNGLPRTARGALLSGVGATIFGAYQLIQTNLLAIMASPSEEESPSE